MSVIIATCPTGCTGSLSEKISGDRGVVGGACGDTAVGGAAAEQAVAVRVDGELERVAVPGLRVGRDDIQVAADERARAACERSAERGACWQSQRGEAKLLHCKLAEIKLGGDVLAHRSRALRGCTQ